MVIIILKGNIHTNFYPFNDHKNYILLSIYEDLLYFEYVQYDKDLYIMYEYFPNLSNINFFKYFNYSYLLHNEKGPAILCYKIDKLYSKRYHLYNECYEYNNYLKKLKLMNEK